MKLLAWLIPTIALSVGSSPAQLSFSELHTVFQIICMWLCCPTHPVWKLIGDLTHTWLCWKYIELWSCDCKFSFVIISWKMYCTCVLWHSGTQRIKPMLGVLSKHDYVLARRGWSECSSVGDWRVHGPALGDLRGCGPRLGIWWEFGH